jgi:hypothetical protein
VVLAFLYGRGRPEASGSDYNECAREYTLY